jgi:hypothetical protein
LTSILKHCRDLEFISLSGCKNVSKLVLSSIKVLILNEMRNLSVIEISSRRLTEIQISWCAKIKDTHISNILAGNPSLKTLKLRGCPGIVSVTFNCPNLETLCLEKCLNMNLLQIEGENMYRLEVKGCSSLKSANLKCRYIKVRL